MKAAIYDSIGTRLDRAGFGRRRDRLVADLDGHVLEVGAGTGLNVARYHRAARITVIEPDRRYAVRLRERAAASAIKVEVIEGRAESIPLPDGSVDHVVTSLALCSVTDLAAAMTEIQRVLRPGGTLEFLEHVRGAGRRAVWQDRLTPVQRFMADNCHLNRDPVAAMEAAGLRVHRCESFRLPAGNPLIHDGVQGTAIRP